jgi:hypothetical protein
MPLEIEPIQVQSKFPLEKKPSLDPAEKEIYSDVFSLQNAFKILFLVLDRTFTQIADYVNTIATGIPEAPIDGQQYARKDAGWVVVTGGGGGGGYTMPDGCVVWLSTSHRAGVAGSYVNYLNSPQDNAASGNTAGPISLTDLTFTSNGFASGTSGLNLEHPVFLSVGTICAVVTLPSSGATSITSTIFSGSASGAMQLRLQTDGSGNAIVVILKSQVGGGGSDSAAGTIAAGTTILITAVVYASSWELRRNGVQTASGAGGLAISSANGAVGYSSGGGEYARHWLGELVVFDRALGTTDLATVENYLIDKYGL